jgi:hypothetical protein
MRVCLKSDSSVVGVIVGDLPHGNVLVYWEDSGERTRIGREQLINIEAAEAPELTRDEQLIDALDRLRDGINLQIETVIRVIKRASK